MLKDVLNPDNEDFGFTKVCISKRRTKLNYDIWCDSLGRERDKNIQPFIMICNTVADKEEWLTISIDKSPQIMNANIQCFKDLDVVLSYVKMHTHTLLMHWFGELDDLELYLNLFSHKIDIINR